MKRMKIIRRTGIALFVLLLIAGGYFYLHPVNCFRAQMYLSEFLHGEASHSVVVDGNRIHYLEAGPSAGPQLVLVHGLGGSTEDWRELTPALARAGFHVYMPDLLGYGRSARPASFTYAVRDEAEFVARFMDAMGIRQADVGGWSMGGGIVQHLAFRHPQRVRRLILFDSAGLWERPQWDVQLFTPQSPAELGALNSLLMPSPPPVPGFVADDVLRGSRANAWVIHRALEAMLTGQDATDKILPQLKMPVLIVWGTRDRILPIEQGRKMQSLLPDGQLLTVEGCGHLAPVQCPEKILPGLIEFLRAPDRQGTGGAHPTYNGER
jgi:pimeloyl-ACP methyl ester carboxylesterase